MANRVRVNVKFGDAKVLVPCGDGAIPVSELIDKAVGRFKRLKKLVSCLLMGKSSLEISVTN